MYKERTLGAQVLNNSKFFKVVLITGMRQIGKTTLLEHLSDKDRKYVTLDDPKSLRLAMEEPELFFNENTPPVFIDEVQYAPELFRHIKILVDSSSKNGRVWMTGSQQYSMMKNVTESLAGRVAIINMMGFSIYERENQGSKQEPFLPAPVPAKILGRKSPSETFYIIWRGSYPKIVDMPELPWNIFYSSYLKSYIERDVRQLVNIGDELTFAKFMGVVAARTGQELNIADIAKDVGINERTATSWLSILEASGIIYLLQPYFKNITKRLIKRPKLYFIDTGLCAYLTGWNTPESLEKGAMSGAIFETFVFTEILKSYHHNGLTPSFYYYRDSNKTEIDLLIHQNGQFFPIEIKKTGSPNKADIKAFDTFAKLENIGYGSLICLTSDVYPLTEKANAISIWDI